jgi:uncharacterized membrane protein HdeD (DUF308 family)
LTTVTTRPATPLRTLYLVRFGFAIVWAVVVVLSSTALATTGTLGPLTAALLVIYPAFDLAAAVVDRRSSGAGGPSALLVVNMALSLAAAVALVVAVMSGPPAVLAVWGAWAITAGAVQLVVAIRRRALGGQWAMILSGGISVLAGAGFVKQAAGSSTSVVGLAGYATLGAVFFLVSALRLRRGARDAAR